MTKTWSEKGFYKYKVLRNFALQEFKEDSTLFGGLLSVICPDFLTGKIQILHHYRMCFEIPTY